MSKLPFTANLRLAIWAWLFNLIVWLVPKEAQKTLKWLAEMPLDE